MHHADDDDDLRAAGRALSHGSQVVWLLGEQKAETSRLAPPAI